MIQKSLAMALALGLLLCGRPALAQSAFEREAKDRAEIEKLMWQYARALDTLNADAYIKTFTPDGQFGGGANATKGHAALHKLIADLAQRNAETESKTGKKPAAMYHTSMNPYLEFVDKDHAIFRAYWTTTFAGDAPNAAARIAAVGWERNELVRVNGKWLIQVRDTAPKDKE
ncbi:MAG: nuclear transport factor 2 family protein [Acidobacteriota bacterium]